MKKKYNLNFLNKEEDKTTKEEIIEYKKESWYMKIIHKLKKLFSSFTEHQGLLHTQLNRRPDNPRGSRACQ